MEFSLVHIWATMSPVAKAVVFLLTALAVASLGVFVERVWYFRAERRRAAAFAAEVGPKLAGGAFDEALTLARANEATGLAQLFAAGLSTFNSAGAGKLTAAELTRRSLARKLDDLRAGLRRGFGAVASTGSIAPFVGLFGTVVGIISAFEGIAKTGSGGLGSVSAGIAEALVVTAYGLAVAIPAVLAFNYLSAIADEMERALTSASGELLDLLEHGDKRG